MECRELVRTSEIVKKGCEELDHIPDLMSELKRHYRAPAGAYGSFWGAWDISLGDDRIDDDYREVPRQIPRRGQRGFILRERPRVGETRSLLEAVQHHGTVAKQ